jgi:hypothetical protein
MESIVYELGDYLTNAVRSLGSLRELEDHLGYINPSIILSDEEELEGHAGLMALGRFMDLTDVKNGKPIEDIKDPLLTRENRWAKEGAGQHKIVEDRYTGSQPVQKYANHVINRVSGLSVKKARKLNSSAISDQEMRQNFFEMRLREIIKASEPPIPPPHVAAARDILLGLDLPLE